MLVAGDEFGRSQKGNNNAYCQDNEISWVNWEGIDEEDRALADFVRRLIKVRAERPLLRRSNYRDGMIIEWLNPGGGNQTDAQWDDACAGCIGLRLKAADIESCEAAPHDGAARELIVVFNAHDGAVEFNLPARDRGWRVVLDTNEPEAAAYAKAEQFEAEGASRQIAPRSLVLFE
jgi:glycogen operon protein